MKKHEKRNLDNRHTRALNPGRPERKRLWFPVEAAIANARKKTPKMNQRGPISTGKGGGMS